MKRTGITPVIASIILAAMVLIIGAGVWSYSNSAASVIASDYTEETMEAINTVQERFVIEHVIFNNDTNEFSLWIYNYGVPSINMTYSSIEINGTMYTNKTIDDTYYTNNWFMLDTDDIVKVTYNLNQTVRRREATMINFFTKRNNGYRDVYYVK